MTSQMIIRMDPELKERLARVSRQEGKTASQAVRELVESYVEERDISVFLKQLWKDIGDELKTSGIEKKDIPEIIKQVRAEKRRNGS